MWRRSHFHKRQDQDTSSCSVLDQVHLTKDGERLTPGGKQQFLRTLEEKVLVGTVGGLTSKPVS